MQRICVMVPGRQMTALLGALQDAGVMHPVAVSAPLAPPTADRRQQRLGQQFDRALADVDGALAALAAESPAGLKPVALPPLPQAVRAARRLHRHLGGLVRRRDELRAERELLARYAPLIAAFERLAASARPEQLRGHLVLLHDGNPATVARLRGALESALGDAVELHAERLPSGETALLVLVPAGVSGRLEGLLAKARLEEVTLPAAYGEGFLAALPRMRARRRQLAGELAAVEREITAFGRRETGFLTALRGVLHDRLQTLAVLPMLGVTAHAAVAEGWVPLGSMPRLRAALAARLGDRVTVEELGREAWGREDVPVVLRNPRLFRPFEALVKPLPLPRYGSLDPTPFVAVFMPMFFGLMVGDLGYGAMLLAAALALGRGTTAGTLRHSAAHIAGACALFTLLFGVLYGELFGDLGRRVFGLRPLLFDREEAVLPFLLLVLALGVVHLLLGLVAGALAALRHDRRHALGRGLEAAMLLLVSVTLLAAVDVLPRGLLHPAVITLLVAFPVLLVVEGIVGPIELLATLGHVLSYGRIMAIGMASVMLAVVANRMVGTFGSVIVGSLFALLFHLVNFALGVFSPTVHALRLHYVEFFGTCYSPGGVRFQPLAHWHPAAAHESP